METNLSKCYCVTLSGGPFSVIPTTDYDYHTKELVLVYLTVCPACRKWYDELGLILTDDQIMKFFGDQPISTDFKS
jgi:hypothetical protein